MTVSTFELAVILGVTDRWVRKLVEMGVIHHADATGKTFDADQCAEAFKRFMAEPQNQRMQGIDERLARAKGSQSISFDKLKLGDAVHIPGGPKLRVIALKEGAAE